MTPQRKLIIQMSGAPGSGKSTLAKSLAKSLNGLVISHDLVKSFFLENEIPFEQSAALTYDFQWALAKEFIAQGQLVLIIDSTCNYPQTLEQGETLARLCRYEYAYIECRADSLELLEERLKSRVTMRSQRLGVNEGPVDAIGARYSKDSRAIFQQWIENPCRPANGAITVNSTYSSEDNLNYVLQQLSLSTNRLMSNVIVSKPNSGENGFSVATSKNMSLKLEHRQPAVLGGTPEFLASNPVPQIFPTGYGFVGDYSAVDSIIHNEPSLESMALSVRQRYAIRGSAYPGVSYRGDLQHRIIEFLGLDPRATSVVCLTSGTNALRAALKAVVADGRSTERNEVIVPALTAVSTAEAVIMEGFTPVIVDVDMSTWMLSVPATARAVSDRTAAIITVDWLGSLCDVGPFRKLADMHGAKLISDSAQSFGATHGQPPPAALALADATIYSTGFPKVLHTGASGGILICSMAQAEWLEQEPSGILRHETLPETDAYLGLRQLDRLPRDLDVRAKVAQTYQTLLHNIPGILFQQFTLTNNYQLTVTIDAQRFGLNAKRLSQALQAENILCSADRMVCLGVIHRLLRHIKVSGDLAISRALGESSLTFPMFAQLTPELCERICSCVKAIHDHAYSVASIENFFVAPAPAPWKGKKNILNIVAKFPNFWSIPIVDANCFTDGKAPWTVLVQRQQLADRNISIDEVSRQILSKSKWGPGDSVISDLIVRTKFGPTQLLISPVGTNESYHLAESSSSASVSLVIGHNNAPEVHKWCSHEGIDGNGRPWLERQIKFYELSLAVRETEIFLKPLRSNIADNGVSIVFPYLASHSLAEMALAGVGANALLTIADNILGEMATCVWPLSTIPAPATFIEQAHFNRMRRRIGIVRKSVPELDAVANFDYVMLNGRKLLGFERVLKALSRHHTIKDIVPFQLGEIHGDLNLHNILCSLEPDAERSVVLIDPRGVPLLLEYGTADTFEPGDYAYDVSKLKFSLSGFTEIRKGFYTLTRDGNAFTLLLKDHPGSATLHEADSRIFEKISSNKRMLKWVEDVEPCGLQSMELRVLLGEAAHYVADSACALGRMKDHEVLPLFLFGLAKLNDVLDQVVRNAKESINTPKSMEVKGPGCGAATIQSVLLREQDGRWPWDVMEILVKSESTNLANHLLCELVGEYLPKDTKVYVSTHAATQIKFPCVLLHPYVGVRGQTNAIISSVRRSQDFFRSGRVPQKKIDTLRFVTVCSTGASSRSQNVSRHNDKLLSPGPWGISPLRLIILEASQLTFPRGGRWIVENDSFFVLGQNLTTRGDSLCLLTSKRHTTGSNSPWRVCIDSTEEFEGWIFASGFREIGKHELQTTLLRPTSAIFMPNNLAQSIVEMGEDYSSRLSPFLIDIVLPRFMTRRSWIELCHSHGYGVNSDLAWINAKRLAELFPKVELADGGDEMVFQHYGSDSEYTNLVDRISVNSLLASLAPLPSSAKWLRDHQ